MFLLFQTFVFFTSIFLFFTILFINIILQIYRKKKGCQVTASFFLRQSSLPTHTQRNGCCFQHLKRMPLGFSPPPPHGSWHHIPRRIPLYEDTIISIRHSCRIGGYLFTAEFDHFFGTIILF